MNLELTKEIVKEKTRGIMEPAFAIVPTTPEQKELIIGMATLVYMAGYGHAVNRRAMLEKEMLESLGSTT